VSSSSSRSSSSSKVHVKICGVTTVEDALMCAELGASAIGLNFVASSPRRVSIERAREIARALEDANIKRVLRVGVVADMSLDAMRALVTDAKLGCLQLHGDEDPEVLPPLLPHAYKAVRIATADDVVRARSFSGDHLLVDAKVDGGGALGGTGASFDWALVRELARERKLTLAGGLRPDNVARAVREVAPYCVDVASGVESGGTPGIKDRAAVAAFLAAARS
jgi:phosphoribosylanthranilate isomerase